MCKCGCNEGGSNQEVARLSDLVNQIMIDLAWARKGHHIVFLQEATDVAAFDAVTGWGSGIYAGWHIADGGTYTYNNTTVTTFDMRDRVPVGAGVSYTVGQMFGEASHTLLDTELPIINPGVNDPGHQHVINDPGHDHGTTEAPHTHAAASDPHTHTIHLEGGGHIHPIRIRYRIIGEGGVDFNALEASQVENTDNTMYTGAPANTNSGDHEHDGATDSTTATVTVTAASTGLGVDPAFTGITVNDNTTGITIDSFGGGLAHNNLQPSSGGLFVQRIG